MTTTTLPLADVLIDILRTDYEVPDDTDVDTDFESLAFDSLVLVEFAVVLSRRFGVDVEDHELQEAGTIAATVELLRAKGVQG
ncbi:acyl carrier protein [Streptomyces sp. NPDC058731]|uniref:acyl carrier protein n=1 Tax=Streptomyces sp. NPDC058731 TaxID=3346613 RepID=UPI00368F97EB